jgi:hypothetical protein
MRCIFLHCPDKIKVIPGVSYVKGLFSVTQIMEMTSDMNKDNIALEESSHFLNVSKSEILNEKKVDN